MKAFKATTAIATVALLIATACSETKTEWVTAPSISPTNAVVTAPDGGGIISLSYSISNPADDGTSSASSSASWISDISVPSEGTVTFSVAENTAGEARTARITITYSYSLAGSKGSVSCDVTVAQSCGDSPAISVQPTAVAAAAEGGSYSFEYTIVNPDAEGSVEASTEEEWITDIDASTSGKVSFSVAENTGSIREGKVTVTYTYPGGTLSDAVTVVQGFPEGEVDAAPEITVTHPAITAAIEGGSYSFEYEVLNPASDGKMDVATDENWITGLSDSNGTVSFSVEENTSILRTGVISLTYTYSGGSVSETVTVVQDHVSGATTGPTGTYICYGKAYDGETSWTLRIFEDDGTCESIMTTGSEELTYLVDGLVDGEVGDYEYYGDHRCSGGAYLDEEGALHIPTQVLNTSVTTTSGGSYYLGYTPCVSESSLSYSSSFPDLVFTPNGDGTWSGDYGIFLAGWTRYATPSSNTFSGSFFDMAYAKMSLEKVSDEIIEVSSVPASAGTTAKKSLENLEVHTGMIAK